jgi:3-oxoacyl-[acyl-carrier protein] reductase
MDLGLKGRVAMVCAASQGLGKAAAIGFAREGANVVICSRDRKRIVAAAKEVTSAAKPQAVKVLPVVADVTRPADIRRLVAAAIREFGRIDILVTNAGGPPVAQFPDLDDRTWEKGIALTLMSAIRCIREVLPYMRKQRWGRVIAITSIAAKQPLDDIIVSSTLRPGILGLAKVLANQYGKDGVLVNCVTPGFIMTNRQKEITAVRASKTGKTPAKYVKEFSKAVPVGRYGDPEELASVIVFLGSERSSYVNGATIAIDGGLAKGLF